MSTSIRRPKVNRSKLPKSVRRIKKKLGDVIEIPTSKGFAYVQYTHESQKMGSLIRVLDGFYPSRPVNEELQNLVEKPHRFKTFCPVYRMINIGDWDRVGNFPVPEFAQEFPVFKSMKYLFKRPKPEEADWFLWDGEREWEVGKLSLEEQMKYPYEVIYPGISLVDAIETGMSGELKLC